MVVLLGIYPSSGDGLDKLELVLGEQCIIVLVKATPASAMHVQRNARRHLSLGRPALSTAGIFLPRNSSSNRSIALCYSFGLPTLGNQTGLS